MHITTVTIIVVIIYLVMSVFSALRLGVSLWCVKVEQKKTYHHSAVQKFYG